MRWLPLFLLAVTWLACGTPARAALENVGVRMHDEEAVLVVDFSRPPAFAHWTQGDASVLLAGLSQPTGRWEVQGAWPVVALEFVTEEGGVRASLEATDTVEIIHVQQAGDRVTLHLHAGSGFDAVRSARPVVPAPEPIASRDAAPGEHSDTAKAQDAPAQGAPARSGNRAPDTSSSTPSRAASAAKEDRPSASPVEAAPPTGRVPPPTGIGARDRALSHIAASDPVSLLSEGIAIEMDCDEARERLSRDQWDMEALPVAAVCLAGQRDWAGAEAHFERILAFDPDDAHAHMGLGLLAQRQGRKSDAGNHFDKAFAGAVSDGQAAQIRLLRDALDG